MADVSSNIPCTLCEEIFLNPRDLAVHILDKHCSDFEGEEDNREEEEEDKSPMMTTTTTSLNNNGGIENIIQVKNILIHPHCLQINLQSVTIQLGIRNPESS